VGGREALPDLRQLMSDSNEHVRRAAAEALEPLLIEEDLEWLAQLAAHQWATGAGETANELLIYLDRKLYCPFEWPEERE
jgi:HEAT repeat protein